MSFAGGSDVDDDRGPGLAVRITRPNGLSAIVDYGTQSFSLTSGVVGSTVGPGQVKLRTILGGVAYTRRLAQLELTAGFALGYGFGSFKMADAARDGFGRQGIFALESDATNALVMAPRVSLWQNLSNRLAAGVTVTYWRRSRRLSSKPANSSVRRRFRRRRRASPPALRSRSSKERRVHGVRARDIPRTANGANGGTGTAGRPARSCLWSAELTSSISAIQRTTCLPTSKPSSLARPGRSRS